MGMISWIDRVKNEEVLSEVKEERNIMHTTKQKRELTGLVSTWVGNAF
jgi:hypothetical protein